MGELTVRTIPDRRGVPCRSLATYVRELLRRLERGAPESFHRVREVAGKRRALLVVDDEAVVVSFRGARFTVGRHTGKVLAGRGTMSRRGVLRLLDGYLEVSDALLQGELEVVGSIEDVSRMMLAIEILLDAAARTPELQDLATAFRRDPCRPHEGELWREHCVARDGVTASSPAELRLLSRLGLLRDAIDTTDQFA